MRLWCRNEMCSSQTRVLRHIFKARDSLNTKNSVLENVFIYVYVSTCVCHGYRYP